MLYFIINMSLKNHVPLLYKKMTLPQGKAIF